MPRPAAQAEPSDREHADTMATSSRYFTIKQFCEEIGIAESTFHDWRLKGLAPRCIKLPNRQIRIRRSDVDAWLESREESGVAA